MREAWDKHMESVAKGDPDHVRFHECMKKYGDAVTLEPLPFSSDDEELCWFYDHALGDRRFELLTRGSVLQAWRVTAFFLGFV